MTPELRALCRADDLHIEGDQVVVSLRNGRGHRISVEDADDCYQLTGVVVRQAVVQSTPNLALHAWSRNRMLALAGFRIDRRGRLVGECWVPKVGLTAEELQLYVRTLAAESDHLESVLTGRDVE